MKKSTADLFVLSISHIYENEIFFTVEAGCLRGADFTECGVPGFKSLF